MKPLIAALLLAAAPAAAQQAAPPPAPVATAPTSPPRLIVAISVDQFSADLFAQYRSRFTGGFARLLTGAVFPAGYQGHAGTETCPGHSTILTGMRPARTGIVANNWMDQRAARPDKNIYCAEDETVPGSDHNHYTVSDKHLRVPTLGEMMKAADPRTRVVSVAGKDRAAVMMGGHKVDELWWWDGKTFSTYAGRAEPAVVTRAKAATAALIARPQEPLPLPDFCRPLDRPVMAGSVKVGQGRFTRAAGDAVAFRYSPPFDAAVFALAAGLVQDMKLGRGPAVDLLAIGASATDYVGHANGTQGAEMCIQMDELDRTLGAFLAVLDRTGVDYEVVLTADHGAHDMAERQQQRAMPTDRRAPADLKADAMGDAIGQALGIAGPVFVSAESKSGLDSDVYLSATLTPAQRPRVLAEAVRRYAARPEVAAVFTAAQLAATPLPTTPPDSWSLAERARASFDPARSGDLVMLLKPRVTSAVTPTPTYVETHGSPWDYDRRVPILFWRRGMTGFEQPLAVETVDIAPTLAATIGLPVTGLDGRCLDLDPGPADTCSVR
jgi:predicted AlkP superfamily pyrophosphatase or phosphodiesterase